MNHAHRRQSTPVGNGFYQMRCACGVPELVPATDAYCRKLLVPNLYTKDARGIYQEVAIREVVCGL